MKSELNRNENSAPEPERLLGETMRTASKTFRFLGLLTVAARDARPDPRVGTRRGSAVPNKGDTAWMLTCTALVLLMSVPALALFYGGLVRSKNMLSVLMQVFVGFSLITVLWCVYGYSLAFTTGNAFIGGFDRLFLKGVFDSRRARTRSARRSARATPMYEIVFVGFQAPSPPSPAA